MACNDWVGTLRKASYRGVGFWVETDKIATGRRLAVHEFPHRDTPYVEDLGRKANTISVTAYVHGDNVGSLEGRLRKACDAGGAARLNLPMARTMAHCEDCSRQYSKDKLGYIAFDLKFVVEGSRPAPFSGLNNARAIEFRAGKIAAPLSAAVSLTFKGIGVPGFVSEAAVEQLRDIAAAIDGAVRSSPVAPEIAGPLLLAAADLSVAAADLIQIGDRGDRFTATSFIAASELASADALVDAVVSIFIKAREGLAPEYAVGFLEPWLSYETPSAPVLSPSEGIRASNERVIDNLVRVAAASQYAAAAAVREYPSRREATQARADVAEHFETVLEGLAGWEAYQAWIEVSEMRGQTVELLSRLVTDLAPVLQVSANRSMPSLWWANRLYGDASRAGELATRNGVKHAAFMPFEFEALSR